MSDGVLSSAVGTAGCQERPPDPSIRWRPFADHGQASPRQHVQTRTAPTPPAPGCTTRQQAGRTLDHPERPRAPPEDLTAAEEARAAALEAAIVAEERNAEVSRRRDRTERTVLAAPRPVSNLSVSAAEEYQYVARDVRRIAIVGGALVVVLLTLWVLSHVLGLGPI